MELAFGWLLFGHLGREKEYVAIIISLTTPEGKLLMMLLSNKSPTLSSNAMENNFKSPPSWGQILRSRPLHASLGGAISLKQAKMVILKRKKHTFCCYKFETSLDGQLVILKNIYIFVHNCTLMLSQQKNVLTSYPLTAACP